jgi:hypothetical protein
VSDLSPTAFNAKLSQEFDARTPQVPRTLKTVTPAFMVDTRFDAASDR